MKPKHRHSLRDGVNAYLRALLGVHDLLVTVACETSRRLDTSPGASGPHAFAVRVDIARRALPTTSIASRPTIVTTRSPLFIEAGQWIICICFRKTETKIFFSKAEIVLDAADKSFAHADARRTTCRPAMRLHAAHRSTTQRVTA